MTNKPPDIGVLGHALMLVAEILLLIGTSYIFWADYLVGFIESDGSYGGWGLIGFGISILLLIWTSYSLAKAQHN